MITGLCIQRGIDFNGNDLTYRENIPSPEHCACTCRAYSGCSFFTWNLEEKICYLKTSDKGREKDSRGYSGKADCCEGAGSASVQGHTDIFRFPLSKPFMLEEFVV